mgnify:CR=1 FL=1
MEIILFMLFTILSMPKTFHVHPEDEGAEEGRDRSTQKLGGKKHEKCNNWQMGTRKVQGSQ